MSSSLPNLPPGWRFNPSDEELITYYLKKKISSPTNPNVALITDINLYKFNPWELPDKAQFGETEWYFFSPRERKYPNGSRPNRAATSGYWKATGTDRPILSSYGSRCIGVKKALVFYMGRPPKGHKTDWMMYEYRLLDESRHSTRVIGSMRLDDWVLCRIRHKSNTLIPAKEIQENKTIKAFSDQQTVGQNVEKQFINNTYIRENNEPKFLESEQGNSFLRGETSDEFSINHTDHEIKYFTDSSVKAALDGIKRVLSIGAIDDQSDMDKSSIFDMFSD